MVARVYFRDCFIRTLSIIILLTWFPFPIWYALSPEGFNVIKDVAGMKVVVAFLNVLAKGSFMMCLAKFRTDYVVRQKTLMAVGFNLEDKMENIMRGLGDDSDGKLDKITCMLTREVLESMGRATEYNHVVASMESQLITSNADVLALTKEYCREIHLPWHFVRALQSKIRSHSIQLGDAWSMSSTNKRPGNVSLTAPHISKNKEKINYVVTHNKDGRMLPDGEHVDGMSTFSTRSTVPAVHLHSQLTDSFQPNYDDGRRSADAETDATAPHEDFNDMTLEVHAHPLFNRQRSQTKQPAASRSSPSNEW